jgi:serine O-acetyltransferase
VSTSTRSVGRQDHPAVSGLADAVRADIDRYRAYAPGTSTAKLLLENQGLWAVIEYRFGRWAKFELRSSPSVRALRVLAAIWHKVIEMTTGISIAHSASLGRGLYVGHFGGIVVGGGVVMGEHCNIGQGVTIGVDGEGDRRGSPQIGDGVHIAPGAIVFGRIAIGSHTKIGANAVVNKDLPSRVLAAGVPAKILREYQAAEGES